MLITLRRANDKGSSIIQQIFEKTPQYFLNTEGVEASTTAGAETLSSLPPNTSYDQKYVFIIEFECNPIGVIDLIDGYPDSETAFLGLLLINESLHRKGLGSQAFVAVEKFISKNTACTKIRLAVIESNPVIPFWRKMGFELSGESKPHNGEKLNSRKLLMEKNLNM